MTPQEIDLTDLVTAIWSTTLDMPVDPLADDIETTWPRSVMEAQVHIAGEWQGAVVLHASQALVAAVARQMFQLADQPPRLEDMQDAFGEIANITGGNVKGLLSESGNTHLSLPTVVNGCEYKVSIQGSHQIARKVFLCGGQPLALTIVQADAEVPADANVGKTARPAVTLPRVH